MAKAKTIRVDRETLQYIRDNLNEALYGTVITTKQEPRQPDGLDQFSGCFAPLSQNDKTFRKNYERLRKVNIVLNCLEL